MKTTIIAFPILVKYGGPPVAVINIAHALAEEPNQELSIIMFGDADSSLLTSLPPNVIVFKQQTISKSIYSLFFKWDSKVVRTVRESDRILIHGYYFWYVFRLAWIRGLNAKLALMPHGVFEPYQKTKSKIRKYLFDLLVFNRLENLVTKILVASESEKFGVREKFKKTEIAVAGLPIKIPSEYRIQQFRTLDMGQTINLLHLGRIAQKKRIDLTINSLVNLRNRGLNVSLNIIGDGDNTLKDSLKRIAQENLVDSHVNFLGQLDGDLKYEESLKNHILVLPSENENFAISVAEALLMGIPCVVSKNVALSEVVSLHKVGVVVNTLEIEEISRAILAILADYTLYQEAILTAPEIFSVTKFKDEFYK